ncbi:uncharacterized protein [Rutidosis leptorrhynchoides]|uniref:uncharacterized protein n=1 Tax=Rutidosis leptorrhynchoides TaxID=125765 RepID=UPI003A98E93E
MLKIKNSARKLKPDGKPLRSRCTNCASSSQSHLGQKRSRSQEERSKQNNSLLQSSTPNKEGSCSFNSINSDGVYEFGCRLGLKWQKKHTLQGFGCGKDSKFGPIKKLIAKEKLEVIALQETKLNAVNDTWIQSLWGSNDCEFIQQEKIGKSGGQLLVWDLNVFEAIDVIRFDRVIGVRGKWKSNRSIINILNIYGPHDDSKKKRLWDSLSNMLKDNDETWILCGDFNEVREQTERFNCVFVESRARLFNKFIQSNNLIDLPLGGRLYTRVIDRFLVTDSILSLWNNLSVVALDRKESDHCPIVLKDGEKNYGPKSFKIFDAWLDEEEIMQIITDAWHKADVCSQVRKDRYFMLKLKSVKDVLKSCNNKKYRQLDCEIDMHKNVARNLELKAETCTLTVGELETWKNAWKCWLDKEKTKASMLKQKARVRWMLEGDENTKYFHSVIRNNYNKRNIRGLIINGAWNDNPEKVKYEAFRHFSLVFKEPSNVRPSLEELSYPSITVDEAATLESTFTEDEILEAVNECGSSKAPDPDGLI